MDDAEEFPEGTKVRLTGLMAGSHPAYVVGPASKYSTFDYRVFRCEVFFDVSRDEMERWDK